jgi:AraC-like DNA-binding protein
VAPQRDLPAELAGSVPAIQSMGRMLMDPIWGERAHTTRGCEALHILQGEMTLILPEGRHRAGPGDTLLVPPGTEHRDEFDVEAGLEIFLCHFDWPAQAVFFDAVGNGDLLALPPHRKAEMAALFHALQGDLSGGGAADRLVAGGRVLTLLLLAYREATAAAPPPEQGRQRRRELLQEARAYLAEHYAECVALDDVAAAIGVSGYYLSHVFSEESDQTLFSYLTTLRLEKAQALLRDGGQSVAEVARAVGYETPNYFSKVFRRHLGCTPSQYASRPE